MPPRKKALPKAAKSSPASLAAKRKRIREAGSRLTEQLHMHGYHSLVIQSVHIDDTFYQIIYVDKPSLGAEELDTLIGIANDNNATLSLRELGIGRHDQSRIALWVPGI